MEVQIASTSRWRNRRLCMMLPIAMSIIRACVSRGDATRAVPCIHIWRMRSSMFWEGLFVCLEMVYVDDVELEGSGDEACGVDACLVFAEESLDEVVLAFLNGLDAEGHAL